MIRSPLRRSTRPMRRTRLNPVSRKQRAKNRTWAKVKAEAMRLANGLCQALIPGVCTSYAVDAHHVHSKGQCGPNVLTNVLVVCRACHNYIELNRKWARQVGLLKSGRLA